MSRSARALRVIAAPARPSFAASRASSASARCAAIPDGVRYSENSEKKDAKIIENICGGGANTADRSKWLLVPTGSVTRPE